MYGSVLYFICFLFIFFLFMDEVWLLDLDLLCLFGASLGVTFVFDFFSLFFLCVVMVVSGSIFIWSSYYMDKDRSYKGFTYLLSLFVLSMFLLILSPSLFFMLLGWDGLGITSYLLVVYYSSFSSSSAGMLTFLTNRVGDIFFLFSISLMFILLSWEFFALKWLTGVLSFTMVMAFITKSAQFPFSSWLPAAMSAPTPVSSLVHSSTLVTAGVFLLIRFYFVVKSYCGILFVLSLVTLLSAGFMALFEWDMKKLIAFSTLSQLGFMVASYSMGLVLFTFFHLLSHALFKSCLFLLSGIVIHNIGDSQEFRNTILFVGFSPLLSVSVSLCLLCLIGFPFLSGFFSKDMILDGMNLSFFLFFFYLSSVILTLAYSLRFFVYVVMGVFHLRVSLFVSYINLFYNFFPIFILLGLSVVMGFFWNEIFFFSLIFGFVSGGWKCFYFFLLGLVVFIFMFLVAYHKFIISYFFSSVFFLNKLTSSVFMRFLGTMGFVVEVLDNSWMEFFGPKNFYVGLYSGSQILGRMISYGFLIVLLFMIIFVFAVM